MKRVTGLLVSAAFILSAGATGFAATDSTEPGWKFDASLWRSDGEAGFEEGDFWGIFSTLEYPLDGEMGEVRAEYRHRLDSGGIPSFIVIRGSYAQSLELDGTSTDRDYDDYGSEINYSESDNEGEATIWSADLMFLVQMSPSFEAGVFAGYGEHSYEFEDDNLYYSYNYGADAGFVPGPISTYDADFTGLRAGLIATLTPSERLSLSAEWAMMPSLEAEAEGFWMLRDYPFWQEAEGVGNVVKVTSSYSLLENLDVFAGLRWVSLIAEDGTEDGILDGQYYFGEEIVEEITSDYVGAEIGVSLQF